MSLDNNADAHLYITEHIFPLLEKKKVSMYTVKPDKMMGYCMLLNDETHSWIYVNTYKKDFDGIVITDGWSDGEVITKVEWKKEDLSFDAKTNALSWLKTLEPIMQKYYIKVLKKQNE